MEKLILLPTGCTDDTGRGPKHMTVVGWPPQATSVSNPPSARTRSTTRTVRQRVRAPALLQVPPGVLQDSPLHRSGEGSGVGLFIPQHVGDADLCGTRGGSDGGQPGDDHNGNRNPNNRR